MPGSALVWFRRDLRTYDHPALAAALTAHDRVFCAFVFDTDILDQLPDRDDRRVEFIQRSLVELDAELRTAGGGLSVVHGAARREIPALALRLGVTKVYAHRDYEPETAARDEAVRRELTASGIEFACFKDHVIFEGDEVLTGGRPYSVFTPYRKAWRQRLGAEHLAPHPVDLASGRLARPAGCPRVPDLQDIGFEPGRLTEAGVLPGMSGAAEQFERFLEAMDEYAERRDFPGLDGTSRLSVHLRFGTASVRRLTAFALQRALSGSRGAEAWLNELIWRDFFFMILFHHPQVTERSFRPEFDALCYDERPDLFAAWCDGRTGFPLVDAAMRQLNHTGYMHNRLRMVAASFLVKDLGVDWRLGERYFARRLIDFDLAANNGGWQWAASTGCDAQPYFRIFNPVTQSERFDPEGGFIRRFVPELASVPSPAIHAPWRLSAGEQARAGLMLGRDYPWPVVDHAAARLRTLERYETARSARRAGAPSARGGER